MTRGFTNVYYVWKRDMKLWLRQKWLLVVSLVGPVLYLLLFTRAMGALVPAMDLAQYGTVTYVEFVSVGIIMMGIFTTALTSSASIFFDKEFHLIYDLFTTPMLKSSYVFGKILGAATKCALVGILLLGITTLSGVNRIGAVDFVVALVAILLISLMISSVATALASHITTQSLYNAVVNVITVPALLFSNTFYPLEVLPPVLRYGAMFNPLTYLNDLLRAILLGAPSTYELASSMFLFIVIAAFGGLECGRSISRQLD